jgi:hypothetical protein
VLPPLRGEEPEPLREEDSRSSEPERPPPWPPWLPREPEPEEPDELPERPLDPPRFPASLPAALRFSLLGLLSSFGMKNLL